MTSRKLATLASEIGTSMSNVQFNAQIETTTGGVKFPDGTVQTTAGGGGGSGGVFGSTAHPYDGGGSTPGANSIGRGNPLRTASANSLLKIGHGTPASPVSANSPAVWQESWVTTDFTSLGDGSQFAQGVAGALFQTFKTGGTGGVSGGISYARGNPNTLGDIIGLRGVTDGKDRKTAVNISGTIYYLIASTAA